MPLPYGGRLHNKWASTLYPCSLHIKFEIPAFCMSGEIAHSTTELSISHLHSQTAQSDVPSTYGLRRAEV